MVKKNTLLADDLLRIEYTWTDHRVYRHRFDINDYYSHGYPLGFWAGPHAQELLLTYNAIIKEIVLAISLSQAKRGELTESMLETQYDSGVYSRYSGTNEERILVDIKFSKKIKYGLLASAGLSYLDWTNAGFEPTGSASQSLESIQKKSLNLSLSYIY